MRVSRSRIEGKTLFSYASSRSKGGVGISDSSKVFIVYYSPLPASFLGQLVHYCRVSARRSAKALHGREGRTYDVIPPNARAMPTTLPPLKVLLPNTQLNNMTRQVLKWPTTVLLTGPAS